MNVSFDLEVDVRCTSCGTARDLPEGSAKRVLEGDVLYADVDEPCEACGATRLAVEVKIDDASEEVDPGSRVVPRRDR